MRLRLVAEPCRPSSEKSQCEPSEGGGPYCALNQGVALSASSAKRSGRAASPYAAGSPCRCVVDKSVTNAVIHYQVRGWSPETRITKAPLWANANIKISSPGCTHTQHTRREKEILVIAALLNGVKENYVKLRFRRSSVENSSYPHCGKVENSSPFPHPSLTLTQLRAVIIAMRMR